MNTEHIGPSLWHGREIISCTRCKYLKCTLRKSGRYPDYDYHCMHPSVLAGEHIAKRDGSFLEAVKERFPDRLEYFTKRIAEQKAEVTEHGEFICNDEATPETPHWCPVITAKL